MQCGERVEVEKDVSENVELNFKNSISLLKREYHLFFNIFFTYLATFFIINAGAKGIQD